MNRLINIENYKSRIKITEKFHSEIMIMAKLCDFSGYLGFYRKSDVRLRRFLVCYSGEFSYN